MATDRNVTVAARVRLDGRAAAGAALSRDGESRSGFALYDPGTDRWQFALPEAEADGAPVDAASSATAPEPGGWTHLAGGTTSPPARSACT